MAKPRTGLWAMALLVILFASPALVRGPYLQSVTATSAIVVWRTDVASDGRIEYGLGSYSHSIDDPTPTTEHALTLTGLMTGTEVMYRVLSGDSRVGGWIVSHGGCARSIVSASA